MKNFAYVQCGLALRHHGHIGVLSRPHLSAVRGNRICAPSVKIDPIPDLERMGNAMPSSFGMHHPRCSLVWLRIGHLRLADNRAVAAICGARGTALPVVTVQHNELTSPCLSAIYALKMECEALGSTIIVRVASNSLASELDSVLEIAGEIHTKNIFMNWGSEHSREVVATLRSKGFVVNISGGDVWSSFEVLDAFSDGRDGFLSEAPKSLPSLPARSHRILTNCFGSSVTPKGELDARTRLTRLLIQRGKGMPLAALVFILSEELKLGCISHARVLNEYRSRCFSGLQEKLRMNLPTRNTFFTKFFESPALSALSIAAYDVNGGDRRGVEWDKVTKSFRLKEWEHTETERRMTPPERWREFWRRRRLFFMRSFFPEDVTPDYYSFTAWRFAQRCASATIGVFGTSSLLFALGIRSGRIGQAAVISWVLKDGLGRVGKMVWAGSMGKDFDVDPKRWRFRSALLYAFGNGLEIVTQIFPASFLVFATLANSMKQVSMLTSSATRNAMYRSFGGRSQNIANITAKGEAQIVVADLIGMGCGIRLSKLLGSSRKNVLSAYLALTVLDIFGIYMELRQVVFRTLNAERSNVLVSHYVRKGEMLIPSHVSPKESIFLKPKYASRVRLSSIAKAAADPEELDLLLKVFRREHFLVSLPRGGALGPCRLVLRKDASNEDVLRAMLMIGYVRKLLRNGRKKKTMTREEQEAILQSSRKSANRNFHGFLEAAREAGWSTDNLLFSTMKRRGHWGRDRS